MTGHRCGMPGLRLPLNERYLVSISMNRHHWVSLLVQASMLQFERRATYTLIVLKTLQFEHISMCAGYPKY